MNESLPKCEGCERTSQTFPFGKQDVMLCPDCLESAYHHHVYKRNYECRNPKCKICREACSSNEEEGEPKDG